jgi:hypothetical protein
MARLNQETLQEMNHTFHWVESQYHEARNLVMELQRYKRYLEDETNEEEIELLQRQIDETEKRLLRQMSDMNIDPKKYER